MSVYKKVPTDPGLPSDDYYATGALPRDSVDRSSSSNSEEYNHTEFLSQSPYTYSPLKEKDAIRLLRIQPADQIDASLHLSIVSTTLSSVADSRRHLSSFTALSYCWGSQKIREPVYVHVGGPNADKAHLKPNIELDEELETGKGMQNEFVLDSVNTTPGLEIESYLAESSNPSANIRILHVGPNLHSALRHIRRSTLETIVWADGLCINQADFNERNHQVHHMRSIYELASKTVVYLGDESGNTCFSAWNYLENEASGESNKGKDGVHPFMGDLGDVEIEVLSRPWFRRVWVVQEVAVSRVITVQCGTRSISWDDFCKIVLLEPRFNDRYGFSLRNKYLFEYALELFLTRCAFLTSYGSQRFLPPWYSAIEDIRFRSDHILDMVSRSRRLEATDPRDKIFALMGISSGVDVDDKRLAVDYSKSVKQVYADFAYYLIDEGCSVGVLSHAELNEKSPIGWPSWVPDWRTSLSASRTILSSLPTMTDELDRTANLHIENCEHPQQDPQCLRYPGTIIGRIDSVSPRLQLQGHDEVAFEQIRQEFRTRPTRMRTEILARWRTYPWNQTGKVERYESTRKHYSQGNTLRNRPTYTPIYNATWNQSTESGILENGEGKDDEDDVGGLSPALISELTLGDLVPPADEMEVSSSEQQAGPLIEHLIQRSRQTVLWTDEESMAVEIVADKTSIVDNRRLGIIVKQGQDKKNSAMPNTTDGIYSSETGSSDLVLIPGAAQVGDYIISLHGGAVPFVIWLPNMHKFAGTSKEIHLDRQSGLLKCALVGECMINEDRPVNLIPDLHERIDKKDQTTFYFEDYYSNKTFDEHSNNRSENGPFSSFFKYILDVIMQTSHRIMSNEGSFNSDY